MRRRVGIAGLFGVVLALAPLGANAQQKPTSQSFEYSAYEKETIARALAATGLQLEPAPEGKTIEGIETLRLEVLEDRDPIPDDIIGIPARKLLNSLHYVSRDFVIRREVLLQEGEPYQQILVDETARNMRG
ncbi:MAG: outer membrane protein assembly factor YaeT precursor, partial [Myxococcaceae bacterium]|nr:outer membrane protein assembly factor YaeT precursor [Myxococcaceae bacterium]